MKKFTLIFLAISFLAFCFASCEKKEDIKPSSQTEQLSKNLPIEKLLTPKYEESEIIPMMEHLFAVANVVYSEHPTVALEKTIADLDTNIYLLYWQEGKITPKSSTTPPNKIYDITDVLELMSLTMKAVIEVNEFHPWPLYDKIIEELKEDMELIELTDN